MSSCVVTFAELAKGGSLLVKRTMELAVRQALEPSNIPSQVTRQLSCVVVLMLKILG